MVRACVGVLVCLTVSAPSWAQPLYVAGTIGSSTPLETRYDYDGIRENDGLGTALTLGGRVGLHLGAWWGVELDVTHRLEQEERQEPDILPLASGAVIDPFFPYVIGLETRQRSTSFSPALWVSYPIGRLELQFSGGVAFERTVTEQEIDIGSPPPLTPLPARAAAVGGPISEAIRFPGSFEIVQYDTRVMTGVDCRVHLGNDLLVIPGLRVLAGGGAWAIRPSVGVGWAF
jgi:hypothetical protein